MPFAIRNLSVLAYANGFTLWHYKAGNDTRKEVTAPGFFNEAADMLQVGDMMMVSSTEGGHLVVVAPPQAGDIITAQLA